MKRLAVACAIAAGCSNNADLEARIDKLEKERLHAKVFYEENNQRFAQVLQLRRAMLDSGIARTTDGEVAKDTGLVPIEAVPRERLWYCHFLQSNPNAGGPLITTCSRTADDCRDLNCVMAGRAWCGRETCTFTQGFCEAVGAGKNAPCALTAP